MIARTLLLAVVMGAGVAMAGCSTVVPDSSPGPTLAPLETLPLSAPSTQNSDAVDAGVDDADATASPDTEAAPTATSTAPPTPTILPTTSGVATSTTTSTTARSTSTVSSSEGLVDGVRATIDGRRLSFASSCREGRAVQLDGVTWSFGGNSFQLRGDDDVRSEAELVGDGWTMPMLVGSVQSGVYTYVGTPVDGSVGSAQVVIDHGSLPNC